ncbi:hypothetical protein [Azospirillum sp. TSH100]|uniref:hypothetical protein n=1 Tax=Azospirillum sp. TSH100 TaxID=652764 RepID=UPI0010AB3BDE|nr:hypothetical protein [Azospirillum sp. TSH100]QCG87275.1 hypothetical protein E6C72_05745 [Azospirillum sp. TSH100]
MDPIPLITSIVAGAFSGFGSAWWGSRFRRVPSIIVSATGLRCSVPDTSILLEENEIICLDNMTRENLPEELKKTSASIRRKFAEKQTRFSGSRDFSKSIKLALHLDDDKSDLYRISLEDALETLRLIQDSPSKDFAAHRSGQDQAERAKKHAAIMDAIKNKQGYKEIVDAIKEIDHSVGEAFHIFGEHMFEVPKDHIENFVNHFYGSNSSPIMDEYSKILTIFRSKISEAERRKSMGVCYEIPVMITNTGQIPVSITKHALFTIDNSDVLIPLECIEEGDVIVIPPSITKEVIFTSPKKEEMKQTWDIVESNRNIIGASANIEIMNSTNKEILKSNSIPISISHNFKSMCINNVLGARKFKYADINDILSRKT